MSYPKSVRITDFLTDKEISDAIVLRHAKAICERIIKPNINRINKALGQKNDPMFLAYMVEYVITVTGHSH